MNTNHPGEILSNMYLKPLGISVTQAAKLLYVARPTLSNIINGHYGISPLMACKLSKAFGTTVMFWMNMQTHFDLSKVDQKLVNKVKPLKRK